MRQVIVIGGGASGLMAAIAAAGQGAEAAILEKNRQVGKKLLVTGNGRCNFSNRNQNLTNYRSDAPAFVKAALEAFSLEDTLAFFRKLGILVKERNGYLYPLSGQAASVLDALRLEAERLQVKLRCNTQVQSVDVAADGRFQVHTEGWDYEADAVILACGSMAAPGTGATGDGYRFAQSFGHRVVKPLPALTGLYAAEKDCGKLAGVRFEAEVTLHVQGQGKIREYGEVQFTDYGLSGIPVFQVSRYAARATEEGRPCKVTLALLPDRKEQEVKRLLRELADTDGRVGAAVLLGVFPDKLCRVLLARAGISEKKSGKDWTEEEISRLSHGIGNMTFHIARVRGMEQAQVCTGGIPLRELKGVSMESSKQPGLYLTGELLDVDGACGGYNLQWAWTSGYLAGVCAAGKNENGEIYVANSTAKNKGRTYRKRAEK